MRALQAGLWLWLCIAALLLYRADTGLLFAWAKSAAPPPAAAAVPPKAAVPPASALPPPEGFGAERLLWGKPLALNQSPAYALQALDGIGEKRARAIVAARPFCALEEVVCIKGIGPKTFAKIKPHLKLYKIPAGCTRAKICGR